MLPTIFERELGVQDERSGNAIASWPITWLGKELGSLFVERMRKLHGDSSDPKERAAIGGLVPLEGRVPTVVEMTTRAMYGQSLPPLTKGDLDEADAHDKTLLARAKSGIIRVITAEDEDEPEEPEQ